MGYFWVGLALWVVIVGLAVLMVMIDDSYYSDWSDVFAAGFYAGILITMVGFVVSLVVTDTQITNASPNQLDVVDEHVTKLRALETGDDVQGSFFLGSGYIDEEPVYTYIEETEDGGFKLSDIDTDSVTVYETNDRKPSIVEQFVRMKDTTWAPHTQRTGVKIYVPVGSVEEPEFRIDTDRGE